LTKISLSKCARILGIALEHAEKVDKQNKAKRMINDVMEIGGILGIGALCIEYNLIVGEYAQANEETQC